MVQAGYFHFTTYFKIIATFYKKNKNKEDSENESFDIKNDFDLMIESQMKEKKKETLLNKELYTKTLSKGIINFSSEEDAEVMI